MDLLALIETGQFSGVFEEELLYKTLFKVAYDRYSTSSPTDHGMTRLRKRRTGSSFSAKPVAFISSTVSASLWPMASSAVSGFSTRIVPTRLASSGLKRSVMRLRF